MTTLATAFVLFLCALLGVVCGFYWGCLYKDKQLGKIYMSDYKKRNRK